MEIVVQAPADDELHLLTEWGDASGRVRMKRAAVLSVIAHAVGIVVLLILPEWFWQPPPLPHEESRVTPLVEPLTVFTQKEPTKGSVSKEFVPSEAPRARIHTPAPAAAPAPPAQRAAVIPPPPKPLPPVSLPEPPKLDANRDVPKLSVPVGPPQIQLEEKRPAAFEDVTRPQQVPPDQRVIPMPGPTAENLLHGAARGRGFDPGAPGTLPTATELPYQLLSDTQGVDFRAYLAQVLATIKRNWAANMPENSVRMGRGARVALQFAIEKDGTVRKIVYAEQTSVAMLDNAAVAAVSQSNPFPSLPANFKGSEIRIQVNFAYNVPK